MLTKSVLLLGFGYFLDCGEVFGSKTSRCLIPCYLTFLIAVVALLLFKMSMFSFICFISDHHKAHG